MESQCLKICSIHPCHIPMCDGVQHKKCFIFSEECPNLSPPANGKKIGSARVEGSDVTFTCNDGFFMKGSPTTTCGSDGQWSGNAPTCSGELPFSLDIFLGGHDR